MEAFEEIWATHVLLLIENMSKLMLKFYIHASVIVIEKNGV